MESIKRRTVSLAQYMMLDYNHFVDLYSMAHPNCEKVGRMELPPICSTIVSSQNLISENFIHADIPLL